MTCGSCVKKWEDYYKTKGFTAEETHKMALKLLKRFDKRLKKEHLDFIPLYLIETAPQGIFLYRRNKGRLERISDILKYWVFQTNWKATFLWSFKRLRINWIGKYGSDYSQNCSGSWSSNGSCDNYGGACSNGLLDCSPFADCNNGPGTCGCPAPLPNSSQVSAACYGAPPSSACPHCVSKKCTDATFTGACTCSGTCAYNCNPPYSWNGSACVFIPPVTKQPRGDGLTWIVALLRPKNPYTLR
jgi:hypothetical protein